MNNFHYHTKLYHMFLFSLVPENVLKKQKRDEEIGKRRI